MTSVRLGPALEKRMVEAAEVVGETTSEFIRAAIAERIERLSTGSTADDLGRFIGAVRTPTGSSARHSGKAFRELMTAEPA